MPQTQPNKSIDIDSIHDIIRSAFKHHGFENQNQTSTALSLGAVLSDNIQGIIADNEDTKKTRKQQPPHL